MNPLLAFLGHVLLLGVPPGGTHSLAVPHCEVHVGGLVTTLCSVSTV